MLPIPWGLSERVVKIYTEFPTGIRRVHLHFWIVPLDIDIGLEALDD